MVKRLLSTLATNATVIITRRRQGNLIYEEVLELGTKVGEKLRITKIHPTIGQENIYGKHDFRKCQHWRLFK